MMRWSKKQLLKDGVEVLLFCVVRLRCSAALSYGSEPLLCFLSPSLAAPWTDCPLWPAKTWSPATEQKKSSFKTKHTKAAQHLFVFACSSVLCDLTSIGLLLTTTNMMLLVSVALRTPKSSRLSFRLGGRTRGCFTKRRDVSQHMTPTQWYHDIYPFIFKLGQFVFISHGENRSKEKALKCLQNACDACNSIESLCCVS